MRRIGIFGGSFNPPHLAHLIAGELAVEAYSLDRLLFIPANIPPHKRNQELASGSDRLAMLKLAIQGNAKFAASDIELMREGTSFTVDTLNDLRNQNPDSEFILFIGLDNLAIFHTWHRAAEILQHARIVVMLRPTHDLEAIDPELRKNVEILPIPLLEISSTRIRASVAKGLTIRYQVSEEVQGYIESHNLYRE